MTNTNPTPIKKFAAKYNLEQYVNEYLEACDECGMAGDVEDFKLYCAAAHSAYPLTDAQLKQLNEDKAREEREQS
jgi:hypothetical protein